MKYLPKSTLEVIIKIFQDKLSDDTITPGAHGKNIFMNVALSRDDFLPELLQKRIDKLREDKSVKDYLFSHFSFAYEFEKYNL